MDSVSRSLVQTLSKNPIDQRRKRCRQTIGVPRLRARTNQMRSASDYHLSDRRCGAVAHSRMKRMTYCSFSARIDHTPRQTIRIPRLRATMNQKRSASDYHLSDRRWGAVAHPRINNRINCSFSGLNYHTPTQTIRIPRLGARTNQMRSEFDYHLSERRYGAVAHPRENIKKTYSSFSGMIDYTPPTFSEFQFDPNARPFIPADEHYAFE